MAIAKMKKFTLLAFESQRAKLLEELQKFSEVEFINLQDNDIQEENEIFQELMKDKSDSEFAKCEDELSMAKWTLDFLKEYVPAQSTIKKMKEGKRELTVSELKEKVKSIDWMAIHDKVKEKEKRIADLEKEKTSLQNLNESLKPWESLDVSFEELDSVKTPLFIGSIPKQYEETLHSEMEECYLEIISQDNNDCFFFVTCHKDQEEEIAEKLRALGFSQFKTQIKDTPIKVIHDNMDTIEKLNSDEFFVKEELAALDADYKDMELVCEYFGNTVVKKEAINNFLKTESVVIIQGWVPEDNKSELDKLLSDTLGEDYYVLFEDVKDEDLDLVPTKLKNNELNSAFEDITSMYSTPRYDEIDPTPLLTPFYLLFFGMMMADIGYGLLQLIGTAIALKVFKFEEGTKRFMKFFFYLSFPIIGFGILYGSFFGDFLGFKSVIDTNKDIMTILYLSIAFGVIQILTGLGIKAYMFIRDGKPLDAFYDVGSWLMIFAGIALAVLPGMLGWPSAIKYIGIAIAVIGAVVIVLKGGRNAGSSKGAQIGQGAYELYGITSYVGDVVSYTRLMALGLAGGSLASAFNLMMDMVPGVAGLLFAPIIFIIGHIFNMALSLLGAYVHTCRLEYVEYFGKFYEGGGKAFTPFKKQNKYINVKND